MNIFVAAAAAFLFHLPLSLTLSVDVCSYSSEEYTYSFIVQLLQRRSNMMDEEGIRNSKIFETKL